MIHLKKDYILVNNGDKGCDGCIFDNDDKFNCAEDDFETDGDLECGESDSIYKKRTEKIKKQNRIKLKLGS